MISEGKWNVKVLQDDTIIESKFTDVAFNLSNEDAEFLVSCQNACYDVNPEHPELVARQIKEMVELTRYIYNERPDLIHHSFRDWAKAILLAIEGKVQTK